MVPWWERWSGRLSDELARLRELGFITEFNENGPLVPPIVVNARYTLAGREYALRITFPELYPYFRPDVQAVGLEFPHHQNPFAKNLCLLGRNTDYWGTDDLIADVIAGQLPKLLASEAVAEGGGQPDEELQAEPWIEYVDPNDTFRILWDYDIDIPSGSQGVLDLSYKQHESAFHAYVSRVMPTEGHVWSESKAAIPGYTAKLRAQFISLDQVPPADDRLVALIKSRLPRYNPSGSRRRLGGVQCALLGLFYPEETRHRKAGLGLTFVLFDNFKKNGASRSRLLRTYRTGSDYVVSRLGPYGSVKKLRVALIGFGSLGSALGATLCKLGISSLTLVDRDPFEPGNAVRHYLGAEFAGIDKVDAGATALSAAYPYTNVTRLRYRLGDFGNPIAANSLCEALTSADVIADCSAERAVQHYLSTEAWTLKKHYLFVEGYPGMLGGFFGVIDSKVDPCFLCYLAGLDNGSIALPPVLSNGAIQPAGCGEPTFVGAPFDSDTIAAAAARLLYSRLAENSAYPRSVSSYCRVNLATADCSESLVRIEPVTVQRRAGCALCDAH